MMSPAMKRLIEQASMKAFLKYRLMDNQPTTPFGFTHLGLDIEVHPRLSIGHGHIPSVKLDMYVVKDDGTLNPLAEVRL